MWPGPMRSVSWGFLTASSFEPKGLQWPDTIKQGTANVKVKQNLKLSGNQNTFSLSVLSAI